MSRFTEQTHLGLLQGKLKEQNIAGDVELYTVRYQG